jgi:hypothetical protein
MPATIEIHGDIEIICQSINELAPNKIARLVFRTFGDGAPPWQIRVKSPSGKLILERVIRELPTGEPQSPPPVTFSVQKGTYEITVAQLKGKGTAEGHATIKVW